MPLINNFGEEEPLFPSEIEDGIDAVIYGRLMLKLGKWGTPHFRRFFLEKDKMEELAWISPAKGKLESRIKLSSIKRFSFGFKEKLFQKHAPQLGGKEGLALTITFANEKGFDCILSVVFKNTVDLHSFANGLQYFVICEKFGLTTK